MTDEIGAVDSPQTTEATELAETSTEDIREALGLAPEPAETSEGETGQAEEGVPTSEAAGPAPTEGVEGTEEERLGKRRIRPRTAEDQQVIDLYRSEGFQGSFDDASRIIYGQDQSQPQQQQQQAAAQQPDPQVARENAEAESLIIQIKDLESQVSDAAENLETGEALTLQRDIMRKELQLQDMRGKRQRQMENHQQETLNTHRQKAVESRDRAFESYPELADHNSVARRQFDDYVSSAQQHPDYAAIFESPIWPELMARDYAARAGLQAGQQPAPQAPPQQAPVMGNQARVLTSGNAAQPANSQPTAQQIVQNLPNLSRDDLYAALGQNDGRRYLQ